MAQPYRRCWGRTRNHTRCAREVKRFFCPEHKFQLFKWLIWSWRGSLLGILGIIVAIYIYYLQSQNPLSGLLTPANEPSPPLPRSCPASLSTTAATTIKAFVGGSVILLTNVGQTTILKSAEQELVSIHRETKGLAVSAQIFGADRRIIAQLRKNVFDINPNNYFRLEHPDKHQLTVYDQQAHQVLEIQYLNTYTVKIFGELYTPSGIKVIISDNEITFGTVAISGNCARNVGGYIQLL